MKIIINENNLQPLVNKILDEEFGELYESKNYTTDSTGEWLTIYYYKNGLNVMIYRDDIKILYVGEDNISPLNVFDLDYDTKRDVISKWFESRYESSVKSLRIVTNKLLN